MDASIVGFIDRNPRQINKIVDQTFFRLLESIAPFDMCFPMTSYMSRKLLLAKFKRHKPTIASIVAEEQEIPATRNRATLTEELFNNLKLGKRYVYTARDFELMHEMNRYLGEAGGQSTAMASDLRRYFFGIVADLIPAIAETAMMLAIEIATTGSCDYTDPITNQRVTLTYDDIIANHFPIDLVGGALWSAAATCTPLENLRLWSEDYYNNLGMWPEKVVMRFTQLRQIADSNEAKVAWLRTMGADSTAPETTGVYLKDEQVMDMVMTRTRCREVLLMDQQYSVDVAGTGEPEDKYFLEEGRVFFAKDGYVERAMVPTVEKDFQPGVYVHSEVIKKSPRVEESLAVANMIPFVPDPRYLAGRKVA